MKKRKSSKKLRLYSSWSFDVSVYSQFDAKDAHFGSFQTNIRMSKLPARIRKKLGYGSLYIRLVPSTKPDFYIVTFRAKGKKPVQGILLKSLPKKPKVKTIVGNVKRLKISEKLWHTAERFCYSGLKAAGIPLHPKVGKGYGWRIEVIG